jgi:hypothetical protein
MTIFDIYYTFFFLILRNSLLSIALYFITILSYSLSLRRVRGRKVVVAKREDDVRESGYKYSHSSALGIGAGGPG